MEMSRRSMLQAAVVVVGAGMVARVGEGQQAHAATSAGLVRATAAPMTALPGVVGVTNHDLNPFGSPLVELGRTGVVCLDADYQSIGIDLGSSAAFSAIRVSNEFGDHTLNRRDLSVYVSESNGSWTRIDTFDFLDTGDTIWLYNLAATGRYVKVHCHRQSGQPAAQVRNGVQNNDQAPESTSVAGGWGASYGAAVDYRTTSIGLDAGSVQQFNTVTFVAAGATSRIAGSNYTVYTSADNATYAPYTGWTFASDVVDGKLRHIFTLGGVSARYVKIHCDFTDDAYTFVINNLSTDVITTLGSAGSAVPPGFPGLFGAQNTQSIAAVYVIPQHAFVAGGEGSWAWRREIAIENSTKSTLKDRAVYITHQQLGSAQLISSGKMAEDYRDLRFADSSGRQLPAYRDQGGVYVRVPSIEKRSSAKIFAYFGNAAATHVLFDASALQVEYGYRTIQPLKAAVPSGANWGAEGTIVRLPGGLLMAVAGAARDAGTYGRFSEDGGHTWSALEVVLPPTDAAARLDIPGGFLLDEDTGVLTFIYGAVGEVDVLGDWMNPDEISADIMVTQTTGWTSTGRPVFATPRKLGFKTVGTAQDVAYALTMTNPIKTAKGTYLAPVYYATSSDGTFSSGVLRSTDQGATWKQFTTEIAVPAAGFEGGVTEISIVQEDNGRIILYGRQQGQSIYYLIQAESKNDGKTWKNIGDGTILASNTFSEMSRDGAGRILLTWTGHNAYGQGSYWRNNWTVAWRGGAKKDRFNGYHDIAGATSLSNPGWVDSANQYRFIESHSIKAGESDRLFFTYDMVVGGPNTVLIEGFDSFLVDSHGAVDAPRLRSARDADKGSELAYSRWWRSTREGSLVLSDSWRGGPRALRLSTTAQTHPAGASRLFPGLRKGSIKFLLNAHDLSSGLRICLQEGFSVDSNAHGTISTIDIDSSGVVRSTADDVYGHAPDVGYTTGDTDPATGHLSGFGGYGSIAFDYRDLSMGVDLKVDREVSSIQLIHDRATTGSPNTRVQVGDVEVWYSATNDADWQLAPGWSATRDQGANGTVITLAGPPITSRFFKVHQAYSDTSYTFVNRQQDILRVFPERPDLLDPRVMGALPVPTALPLDQWRQIELRVDLDDKKVKILVDGDAKGTFAVNHPAETLTHLLLLTGTGGSTDVEIDELIVRDLGKGTPALKSVAAVTAV